MLKNIEQNELDEVISYLIKLDSELGLSKPLEMLQYEDSFINEQISLNYTGCSSLKHLNQISSIVGHIKKLNLSDDTTCLIELGAGRGKLSHWLSLSLNNSNNRFLLVERGSQRYKFDGQHREDDIKFERVRMDIKNLFLSELDLVKKCNQLVLYGKHLCGPATDFTLHCLKRTLLKEEEKKFKGLLLAICCHHYCEWETFCGKKFFKKLNLTRKQFYIIRNLSSWATCGQVVTTEIDSEKILYKENIGYMCKNLIDMARMNYLFEKNNFNEIKLDAKLFYYCDQNITLENRMLLVTPVDK